MEKQFTPFTAWDRYAVQCSDGPTAEMIYSAVKELQVVTEMMEFIVGYARWLGENSNDPNVRENALQVAGENIGMAIAQYNLPNKKMWLTIEGLKEVYPH